MFQEIKKLLKSKKFSLFFPPSDQYSNTKQ
jgi:hypothetical protein